MTSIPDTALIANHGVVLSRIAQANRATVHDIDQLGGDVLGLDRDRLASGEVDFPTVYAALVRLSQ